MTARIAVFASGTGSNLEALLRHLGPPTPPRGASARVALVASNRAAAGALAIAARHGVPTSVITDPADGPGVAALLAHHQIDFVALAGYLKQIPVHVTETLRGRILNVHPALLPAFGGPGMYGARVHQAVIDAGVRVTGVTVHFVDSQYDHGPIVAQWPVPVWSTDTPTALAHRVLRVEHRLYPEVVEAVVAGHVSLGADGRVRGRVFDAPGTAAFSLESEEHTPCG